MRVTLPHQLGTEEVRRRMRERSHEIEGFFPAGMASVRTDWPSEDVMGIHVNALGNNVEGAVEVYDDSVVIEMDLPAALSFMRGMIERSVKKEASKLLEKH